MKIMRTLAALCTSLMLLTACSSSKPPPSKPSIVGEWKEYWGNPDISYHDRYRITLTADGVDVTTRNDPDIEAPSGDLAGLDVASAYSSANIRDARFDGRRLTLIQRTSFDVHYDLVLQPDGQELVGSVTTPDETVPNTRWVKINPTAP